MIRPTRWLWTTLFVLSCSGPGPRRDGALPEIPPNLAAAEERWNTSPDDLGAIVWYGRQTAYEGRFAEAVAIYTRGLRLHPGNPELLRHRGHRYLSLRRFEEARRDLEQAARALEGTADRPEPDGAPNAYGVPRSTLHTNVWYHLGLAYHCMERDDDAARAFAWSLALATNDDHRVASAYWRALALFHLGRIEEARALAALYEERDLVLMESFDYASLLGLFAGTSTEAQEELEREGTPLSRATLGYGVAMGHRLSGRDQEALALLDTLVGAGDSSAFGRIAAEVELVRMANTR